MKSKVAKRHHILIRRNRALYITSTLIRESKHKHDNRIRIKLGMTYKILKELSNSNHYIYIMI